MNPLQEALDAANIQEKVIEEESKLCAKDKNKLRKIYQKVSETCKRLKELTKHVRLKKRIVKLFQGTKKTYRETSLVSKGYVKQVKKETTPVSPVITLQAWQKIQQQISKKENIIFWDIENISYKEIDKILSKLDKLGRFYCVCVRPLSQKMVNRLFPYVLLYDIRVLVGHQNSDERIIELVKNSYQAYEQVTIISSDSDFAFIIKQVLSQRKKVTVILNNYTKKRMLMYLKLDHPNLSIIAI